MRSVRPNGNEPHARVAIATARAALSQLGLDEVGRYVNSGNPIFSATGERVDHKTTIRAALEAEFGFEVTTFVRTAAQVRAVVDERPFGNLAPGHTHFALLPLTTLTAREKRAVEAMSTTRTRWWCEDATCPG